MLCDSICFSLISKNGRYTVEPFFNPDVTPEMTRVVAQRAWFSFNVNEHNDTGMDGANGVDWRLAGEGVDTIDEAIKILQNGTNVSLFPTVDPVVSLDYGAVGECLIRVGIRNLQDLRTAFIADYGVVNRPDVYGVFDDWNGHDVV